MICDPVKIHCDHSKIVKKTNQHLHDNCQQSHSIISYASNYTHKPQTKKSHLKLSYYHRDIQLFKCSNKGISLRFSDETKARNDYYAMNI